MKKLLLSISLTLIAATSFGQFQWGIDFDTPWYLYRVYNDTVSNPNCIWQVGHPSKTVFTSAHSVPNVIVTDTLNPVPANDTSVFYLKHVRDQSQPFHIFVLHFWYQMDGDSTDFGKIEISPDAGTTWINLLTQDTTFQFNWGSPKPTLTGSTSGWTSFDLDMATWASYPVFGGGPFPILLTADTILFRFTYITDSSSAPHDGWMIDDFFIEDWFEGIEEIQNDNLISISPNPTADELRIHRTKVSDNSRIQIFNYTGQVLYEKTNFNGETIDTRQLSNGIYLLKYSDAKNFSITKFIVEH
jgi:hypothetical protein